MTSTDTKRLNWLGNHSWGLVLLANGWAVQLNREGTAFGPEDTTQRRAIDAAIKADAQQKLSNKELLRQFYAGERGSKGIEALVRRDAKIRSSKRRKP